MEKAKLKNRPQTFGYETRKKALTLTLTGSVLFALVRLREKLIHQHELTIATEVDSIAEAMRDLITDLEAGIITGAEFEQAMQALLARFETNIGSPEDLEQMFDADDFNSTAVAAQLLHSNLARLRESYETLLEMGELSTVQIDVLASETVYIDRVDTLTDLNDVGLRYAQENVNLGNIEVTANFLFVFMMLALIVLNQRRQSSRYRNARGQLRDDVQFADTNHERLDDEFSETDGNEDSEDEHERSQGTKS
jgi:hypothetical protein